MKFRLLFASAIMPWGLAWADMPDVVMDTLNLARTEIESSNGDLSKIKLYEDFADKVREVEYGDIGDPAQWRVISSIPMADKPLTTSTPIQLVIVSEVGEEPIDLAPRAPHVAGLKLDKAVIAFGNADVSADKIQVYVREKQDYWIWFYGPASAMSASEQKDYTVELGLPSLDGYIGPGGTAGVIVSFTGSGPPKSPPRPSSGVTVVDWTQFAFILVLFVLVFVCMRKRT